MFLLPALPPRLLVTSAHTNLVLEPHHVWTRHRATTSTAPRPHRPLPACPGPTTHPPALRVQMLVCPQTLATQCQQRDRHIRPHARQAITNRTLDSPRASTPTPVTTSTQEGLLHRPYVVWGRTTLTRHRVPARILHLGTTSRARERLSRRPAAPGPTTRTPEAQLSLIVSLQKQATIPRRRPCPRSRDVRWAPTSPAPGRTPASMPTRGTSSPPWNQPLSPSASWGPSNPTAGPPVVWMPSQATTLIATALQRRPPAPLPLTTQQPALTIATTASMSILAITPTSRASPTRLNAPPAPTSRTRVRPPASTRTRGTSSPTAA